MNRSVFLSSMSDFMNLLPHGYGRQFFDLRNFSNGYRQVLMSGEMRLGRIGHALRPDMEAPALLRVLVIRGDGPNSPDALSLIEALVKDIVLLQVAFRPV